jgi:hypothetical protein
MKRLIKFDNFNKNENNIKLTNTTDLHNTYYINENKEEEKIKSNSEEKIKNEIDKCIKKYKENPEDFKKYNIDELRETLLKKAKDNKFRGYVTIRKSQNEPRLYHSGKKFIIYVPGMSTMQKIGKIVANE